MSQHMHEEGKPMATSSLEPREVCIERAASLDGPRGVCSCCHGPAPTGVRSCEGAGWDPIKPIPHVLWCLACAKRIGAAAGMVEPKERT